MKKIKELKAPSEPKKLPLEEYLKKLPKPPPEHEHELEMEKKVIQLLDRYKKKQ